MANSDWLNLLTAALGGGVTVKVLDIVYDAIRRHFESSKSAKQFVDEHLDPLLKAADELVGKLRSLAEQDFKGLRGVTLDLTKIENNDFSSLAYLLAKFWVQIEIFRQEGLAIAIERWSHFLRQPAKVDSPIQRTDHHEDAETVFG